MLPLTCYDCGLVLRGGIADYGIHANLATIGKDGNFIDIIHAAALLRYFVVYRKDSALVGGVGGDQVDGKKKNNADNPDLVREAFSRLIAVKPQCNVLKEKEVDFK